MKVIEIKSTDDTPKVLLDAENNNMEISGRSLPENVSNFYQPIIEWVKEYAQAPNAFTTFRFRLEYFNTASSKNILTILLILKEMHQAGKEVKVEWEFYEDDEEMQESGEELERITKIPFKHVRISE